MTTTLTPVDLGREVRRIWVEHVRKAFSNPNPSWVAPWEDLDAFQRSVDMAIGVGIARMAERALTVPAGAVTAVQFTDVADWETLEAWTGGTVACRQADVAEFEFELALPDGTTAAEGDWLIKTDDGVKIATTATEPAVWFPETLGGMLTEMHAHFGLHRGHMPAAPTADVPGDITRARIDLMLEEFRELNAALLAGNLIGIADGIADLIITAAGTGVAYGLPVDALIAAVHASNMTKVNDPASPKLIKGDGYRPPAIAAVLAAASPGEGR